MPRVLFPICLADDPLPDQNNKKNLRKYFGGNFLVTTNVACVYLECGDAGRANDFMAWPDRCPMRLGIRCSKTTEEWENYAVAVLMRQRRRSAAGVDDR